MTSHPERESGRTVDEACARAEGVGCPMCRSKDTYSFVSGGCRKCGEEWTDGLPVSAPVTQPVLPPAPAVSWLGDGELWENAKAVAPLLAMRLGVAGADVVCDAIFNETKSVRDRCLAEAEWRVMEERERWSAAFDEACLVSAECCDCLRLTEKGKAVIERARALRTGGTDR